MPKVRETQVMKLRQSESVMPILYTRSVEFSIAILLTLLEK
jgi:hypothetical protein